MISTELFVLFCIRAIFDKLILWEDSKIDTYRFFWLEAYLSKIDAVVVLLECLENLIFKKIVLKKFRPSVQTFAQHNIMTFKAVTLYIKEKLLEVVIEDAELDV